MTARPPDSPTPQAGESGIAAEVAPPVVAVVVTRNAGPFLEAALAGLGAQDYPALSVLVVDAGSSRDPAARVGAALPAAFVRRLDGSPGFGGAANEALAAVQGATFFLVCHDDVVLDPQAVRVMVEEAFRSNAAIVGPKLVAADNPSVILEVGRAIDRVGGSHTGIEPGEVDQEQHDAVRDVFYVSSAAMLVRADLFEELGGFDPDSFPGSEDLDLCWRARLAGARVMVAPDARGLHSQAAAERAPGDEPSARELARHRVRVVLTAYSTATLLWVVPLGLAVSFAEAIAFLPTRRRSEALAGLGAWWWNLVHFGRVRPARRRAQALRRVDDSELRALQVGGGARFGSFLSQHHADERMQSLGDRGRDALDTLGDAMRHPASLAFVAFLVLLVMGSRDLFSGGVPAIGTLAPWPGVRALGTELTSAWRHTGLGSTAAPPPVLALMAVLGTVLFGGIGLAETLVVVGAFVVGAFGAARLARALGAGTTGAAITGLAYGVSAVPRNDVANGRLGPLVLFALVPFIAQLVVRCGRYEGVTSTSRRPVLGVVIVTAIAAAWYPPAALAGVAFAVAFLVASVVVGGVSSAFRGLGAALAGVAGAALLLVPWTGTLLDAGSDRGALGLGFRSGLGLGDVLAFKTGPNGGGIAGWGLLVAAASALFVATGPQLAWVTRAWVLAIVGFAAVELPAKLAPDAAVAAPEAGLALAALGLALAAGVAVTGVGRRLAGARVGWQQLAGIVAVAGITFASLGFLGDVVDGRWRASDSWGPTLNFTQDRLAEGDFQILWVGSASLLPLDPVTVDPSLSWVLTRNGPGDARELWRAPTTTADDVVGRALQAARAGKTSRLGRMLAPMGVRYIAFTLRNGPGGARGPVPPGVGHALSDQLDLARLTAAPGLVLYENTSWIAARSVVGARVPTGAVDPLRSAVRTDLRESQPLTDAPAKGTVVLAEAYDDGWSATASGTTLSHERAFGLTNAFDSPSRGRIALMHDGQSTRYLLVLGETALWLIALVWWSRGRRKGARARTRHERRERDERARHSVFDEFDESDDAFWERG